MKPWKIALLSAVVITTAVAVWKMAQDRVPPPPPYAGPVIYATVPSEDRLVLLQAGPSIDREIPVGRDARLAAVSPSGGTVYLAVPGGIRVVDATVSTPANTPLSVLRWGALGDIQLQPGGTLLAAAATLGHEKAVDGKAVLLFDVATKAFVKAIPVSGVPTAVGFSLDGKTLYAGSDGVVDVIDVALQTVVSSDRSVVGIRPSRILASPIGVAMYVLTPATAAFGPFPTGQLTNFDPATHKPRWSRPIFDGQDMALNPTGDRVLIGGMRGAYAFDSLTGLSMGFTHFDLGAHGKGAVGVSVDGARALVLGGELKSDLFVINPAGAGLVDLVPFETETRGLLVDPIREVAYTLVSDRLVVLNLRWLASGRELASISTGKGPSWVTVHGGSHRAYVSNVSGKSITAVDTVARSSIGTTSVPFYPGKIAIDAAGSHLYGTKLVDPGAWVLDVATGVVTSIDLESRAEALTFNEQGTLLFVALPDAHKVAVISTVSKAVIERISVGDDLWPTDLVVVRSDGVESLYVASQQSGSIRVFTGVGPFSPGPVYAVTSPRQLVVGRGLQDSYSPSTLNDQSAAFAFTADSRFIKLDASGTPVNWSSLPGSPPVVVGASGGYRLYATNSWGPIWQFRYRGSVLAPLAWGGIGTGGIAVQ